MATGRNVSRYKRPFYWTASVLLVMVLLRGYVTFYFANAIEAWIIDAETRKPVEGAVVVARWTLEYEGGADYDMVVLETVTDKNGRFTFPAWGPQPKPVSLPWDARLKYADPEVKFYKFGYAGTKRTPSIGRKKSMHVLVTMDYTVHGPSVRGWALNGETFEYKPAKADLKLLTEELYEFHRELNRLHGGGVSISTFHGP
jgi:hypothetical protein